MSSRGFFEGVNAPLAVFASAATIISIVASWQWKSAQETVTTRTEVAEELSSSNESVRTQRDQLASEIQELRAENDALKEDGTSGGTSRPLTPAVASSVYRQGQITFHAETYPTDFDAPLSDPQWGRDSQTAWPGEDDLTLGSDGALRPRWGAQLADPLQGPASYEACTTANYSDSVQELVTLPDGVVFCVRTTEDRFVGLELLTHDQDRFTFQVTTWNSGVR